MPSTYKYHVVECETFEELQKAFNDNAIRLGFYFYGVYQLQDKVAIVFAVQGASQPRVPTLKELKKELAWEYAKTLEVFDDEKSIQCQFLEKFLEWIQKQGFTIAVL